MSHLERIVTLIDMDCFYCQVEEKLNPNIKGKPIAVVQYNQWRGGGIIAVNYIARRMGVTRSMRGDEAKEKCPEIELCRVPNVRGKADLTKFREAGKDVANVLQTFTPLLQRASVDEAYLDITNLVDDYLKIYKSTQNENSQINMEDIKNTHIVGFDDANEFISNVYCQDDLEERIYDHAESNLKLLIGAKIVEDVRKAVKEKTGFDCSAGIAHNKILAKLVCGLHKPNQQTVLPHQCVEFLYKTLPVSKIRSLGGKFGETIVKDLNITYMSELEQFSEKYLQQKYGEKNGIWLYNIARGIDNDPVQIRIAPKSIGCCKRFPGKNSIKTIENLRHWLTELTDEVIERLNKDIEEYSRKATSMVVSYSIIIDSKNIPTSKTRPLIVYDRDKVVEEALQVIVKNNPVQKDEFKNAMTYLGIICGKFEDINCQKNGIKSFFKSSEKQEMLETKLNFDETNEKTETLKQDCSSVLEKSTKSDFVENNNGGIKQIFKSTTSKTLGIHSLDENVSKKNSSSTSELVKNIGINQYFKPSTSEKSNLEMHSNEPKRNGIQQFFKVTNSNYSPKVDFLKDSKDDLSNKILKDKELLNDIIVRKFEIKKIDTKTKICSSKDFDSDEEMANLVDNLDNLIEKVEVCNIETKNCDLKNFNMKSSTINCDSKIINKPKVDNNESKEDAEESVHELIKLNKNTNLFTDIHQINQQWFGESKIKNKQIDDELKNNKIEIKDNKKINKNFEKLKTSLVKCKTVSCISENLEQKQFYTDLSKSENQNEILNFKIPNNLKNINGVISEGILREQSEENISKNKISDISNNEHICKNQISMTKKSSNNKNISKDNLNQNGIENSNISNFEMIKSNVKENDSNNEEHGSNNKHISICENIISRKYSKNVTINKNISKIKIFEMINSNNEENISNNGEHVSNNTENVSNIVENDLKNGEHFSNNSENVSNIVDNVLKNEEHVSNKKGNVSNNKHISIYETKIRKNVSINRNISKNNLNQNSIENNKISNFEIINSNNEKNVSNNEYISICENISENKTTSKSISKQNGIENVEISNFEMIYSNNDEDGSNNQHISNFKNKFSESKTTSKILLENNLNEDSMKHGNISSSENVSNNGNVSNNSSNQENISLNEIKCDLCEKMILLDDIQLHKDYHYALDLAKEQHVVQLPPVIKNNSNKTKIKSAKKKNEKNQNSTNILVFFNANNKIEDDDGIEKEICAVCKKRIPLSSFLEHLDYHEAKKVQCELNRQVRIDHGEKVVEKKLKIQGDKKRKNDSKCNEGKKVKIMTEFFKPK